VKVARDGNASLRSHVRGLFWSVPDYGRPTEAEDDMSNAHASNAVADLKLEVVVLPVADVDRSKQFYSETLGWRLDADATKNDGLRVVQVTPPGSECSVIFGHDITSAAPGTSQGLQLIVSDIATARDELIARGVGVSELFHDVGGVFHHAGTDGRVAGPAVKNHSYGTFASFDDPDGNGWLLQEITTRLPGRVERATTFASSGGLAEALRRAAAAHGEHEQRIGKEDPDWPAWYADYMVREQAGEELPT
jgi:catechol 2,3-dioxygenase-like lactoylglutathione lyase family enzyme